MYSFIRRPLIQQLLVLLAMFPLASVLFLHDLADLSTYHIDEMLWIPYGNYVFHLLFIQHDIHSSFWDDDFYTYGAYNPPIGKYLIGLGTYAAGYSYVPFIERYDWQRSTEWNIAQGNIHTPHVRAAARFPIAFVAIATCMLLCWFVASLTTHWHGFGTVVALLGGQLFLVDGRSAMLDVPAVFFTLLSLVLLRSLVAALRTDRVRAALGWAASCGIVCGLAIGTKLTGGLAIIACIAVLALEWGVAFAQRRRTLWPWLCSMLIGIMSTAVFIGTNPFLYHDPIGGIRHMLSFTDIMQKTTGSFATNDIAGKLMAVVDQLLTFAPLRQRNIPGDTVVFAAGLIALGIACQRNCRACWELQISTVIVWIVVTFVGITIWLPIAYPRYTLPIHLWSAFIYTYGAIWLVQLASKVFHSEWVSQVIRSRIE